MNPSDANSGKLRRELGVLGTGALVTGTMIGTGIFFFVSPVAEQLGSRTAILAAWFVGGLIAATGALCISELASRYPRAGGTYAIFTEVYGPTVAFTYAWAAFAVMRVGNLAIFALAFSSFAAEACGLRASPASQGNVFVAMSAIIGVTAVNAVGVRFGSAVQIALTFLKIAALIAVLMVGATFLAGILPVHDISGFPNLEFERANTSVFLAFVTALIPVLWTLGGWDEPAFVAEEVKRPEHTLPLAIVGGLALVTLLYLLVNAAYLGVLTPDEVAASGNATATLFVRRALGGEATRLLSFVLAISTIGAANGMVMTGARIPFAIARNESALGWFGELHPRAGTPVRALAVQALLVIAAIVLMADPFVLLLYTGLAYWSFSALMAAAVIVARRRDRRRRPMGEPAFRLPFYPWVPLVFIVASLAMCVAIVFEAPWHAATSAAIVGLGYVLFLVQRGLG